jgi:hypothetical protein
VPRPLEIVERQHRQDRARGAFQGQARQAHEAFGRGRRGDGFGRVVRVDQRQIVAMAHRIEHPQEIGREHGIETFEHHQFLPRRDR